MPRFPMYDSGGVASQPPAASTVGKGQSLVRRPLLRAQADVCALPAAVLPAEHEPDAHHRNLSD